jgi:hypothetical protein
MLAIAMREKQAPDNRIGLHGLPALARPSARITGSPFRDHLPYQGGPVARSRMKGREAGWGGLIADVV